MDSRQACNATRLLLFKCGVLLLVIVFAWDTHRHADTCDAIQYKKQNRSSASIAACWWSTSTVARNLAWSLSQCVFVRLLSLWTSGMWRRVVLCVRITQWFSTCGFEVVAFLQALSRRWMWKQIRDWKFHCFSQSFNHEELLDGIRCLIKWVGISSKQTFHL